MTKLILYDFDGPIVDTVRDCYGLYNSLCDMFNVNRQWFNLEEFREWVSGDWRKSAKKLGIEKEIDKTTGLFREYRLQHPPQLQEGVAPIIKSNGNYKQGILSGEEAVYIKGFLRENGLESYFDQVLGADNLTNPKPSPQAIVEASNLLNIRPEEVTYVCDTIEDIELAHGANSKVIAVSYGWHPRKKLEKAKPDYLVDSSEELGEVLKKL